MKRWFLLAALAATTAAHAVTLYTVTVTAQPATPNIEITILPADKAQQKKYFKVVKGSSAKFMVPAGKYSVSVTQSDTTTYPNSIDYSAKVIVVKSNQSVVVPVAKIKAVSVNAGQVFTRLLLHLDGERVPCTLPTDVSEWCADTTFDPDAIRDYIDQDPRIILRTRWADLGGGSYAVGVAVGQETYTLGLYPGSTTRLMWKRL